MKGKKQKPHMCRVVACPHEAPFRRLFCAAHWQRLPAEFRDRLLRASATSMEYFRASGDALKWYADARNLARVIVREQRGDARRANFGMED